MEVVVVVGTPADSFKLAFESIMITVLGEPPSVNVAAMNRQKKLLKPQAIKWEKSGEGRTKLETATTSSFPLLSTSN